MKTSFIDPFKNLPKVEPNDEEFVLCGEFVDSVPSASTALPHRTEDYEDPLSLGITGDNPFRLKELKIVAKDCLQELASIKADLKDEPEENIYDDSFESEEVHDPSTDKQIVEHQTKAASSFIFPRSGTSWIYRLKKTQLTQELQKIGLPANGNVKEQRSLLYNFVLSSGDHRPAECKTTAHGVSTTSAATVHRPAECKTADHGVSATSAATPECPKSTKAKPRPSTGWIHKLNKVQLTEELQKIGLPTTGNFKEQRGLLCNYVLVTGYCQPAGLRTTDSGASSTSAGASTTSASKPECPNSDTSSSEGDHDETYSPFYSESDHDESYSPKKRFSISDSRKKTLTLEKGESSKGKNLPVKTVPDSKKLTRYSPPKNDSALKTPQSNSLLLPEKPSLPAKKRKKDSDDDELTRFSPPKNDSALKAPQSNSLSLPENSSLPAKKRKKKDSDDDEAEVDGVLWSCCDMQFELFSTFNDHKVQEHSIEELKCSVCIDQSFSSIGEIEKHYLDVHTDSSWTSFHCLDCRLVFGVKSSFFDHKAKCCESRSVCSGILDSILNFAVTRKKSKKVKVSEVTAFRLSCCENIIENFEDFVIHKFSVHNIPLLTCGLCLCVKDTEAQLRSHYRKFHFSRFSNRLELKKRSDNKEGAASAPSTSTEKDVLNDADDGFSDTDGLSAKPVQCSALQDGILCRCCNCTKLVEGTQSVNATAVSFEKPFKCEPCNLQYSSKSGLDRHLSTHEGIKPFPCDLCGRAFTRRISLKNHKLYKHSSNPLRATCTICDKVFVSKSALKKHITNLHIHVKKNIQFKCEHCEKIYVKRSSYLSHNRMFHNKSKEFICYHCSAVFYDRRLLVTHMQIMHLPNEKYECLKCDATFKIKGNLYAHNIKAHSDRQFSCEVCGKMFRTKPRLETHMIVHSDDKLFICQACGKGFKRYVNLQQHQYTHSDSRPHVCNICGKTFRLRTHVKQHMAVHGVRKN